jgi:hypothetical protein
MVSIMLPQRQGARRGSAVSRGFRSHSASICSMVRMVGLVVVEGQAVQQYDVVAVQRPGAPAPQPPSDSPVNASRSGLQSPEDRSQPE